jgi:hypothetical protein
MAPIGRGSLNPSTTKSGKISCRGATLVSATIARMTLVVRSRLGLMIIESQ